MRTTRSTERHYVSRTHTFIVLEHLVHIEQLRPKELISYFYVQ
jgi:hypothetical protein